jgi:hypothetical protein
MYHHSRRSCGDPPAVAGLCIAGIKEGLNVGITAGTLAKTVSRWNDQRSRSRPPMAMRASSIGAGAPRHPPGGLLFGLISTSPGRAHPRLLGGCRASTSNSSAAGTRSLRRLADPKTLRRPLRRARGVGRHSESAIGSSGATSSTVGEAAHRYRAKPTSRSAWA